MNRIVAIIFVLFCISSTTSHSETIADFLIINDIGLYKLEKPFVTPVGLVINGGEPKLSRDGNEADGFYSSYTIGYDGGEGNAGPNVVVRVYDSTQWMLHSLAGC